jgi:hypothetical protein
VRTKFGHKFKIPQQEQMSISACFLKHLICGCSWKNRSIISVENLLHEIQCTPRHVSSWTAASVQRFRGSFEKSDKHPQRDGEEPIGCQQERHIQVTLGVPTVETQENSDLESVEVM